MHKSFHLALMSTIVGAVLTGLPATVAAQDAHEVTEPRRPDGRPDLQGVWHFNTTTPLQRPEALADQVRYTEEEHAALSARTAEFRPFDAQPPAGSVGAYNQFWWDRGGPVDDRRTSLIVDPADGKLPSLTADAQKRHGQLPAGRNTDSYEGRTLSERCIVWPHEGPPMLPPSYNDILQIFQTPDHIVMLGEMIHDARVIPISDSPHISDNIRQWHGDARGHWEEDTLVVETTNFDARALYRNSGEGRRLVERFTRIRPDTLHYEITVADPSTWTRPWTALVPLSQTDDAVYEYACHEGNIGMHGILAGARRLESQGRELRP